MRAALETIAFDFLSVIRDVGPMLAVILFYQLAILRKKLPNVKMIILGFLAVMGGLYLFLIGLDISIFPIGEALAEQFAVGENRWWLYAFAFAMGYSTTMAEPALLAIAIKAEEISAGGLPSLYLRNAVATGVALGLTLGVYRLISGDPLWIYILIGYIVTIALTYAAPKEIVPLAYDSGGVTTSTITVPLVAALGLGLATHIPGRNPLIDGFGLIAFASVFPMISVLGYATIIKLKNRSV